MGLCEFRGEFIVQCRTATRGESFISAGHPQATKCAARQRLFIGILESCAVLVILFLIYLGYV
jgi:hypothetical protein